MSNDPQKGGFSADIPADAVAEALRSVEKLKAGAEVAIEPEGAAPAAVPATGDSEKRIESLELQLELSTNKGAETLKRLNAEHDAHLRVAADLENYKKRAAKEKEEIQKFGLERVLKDVLPVVDNLDRALAHAATDDPLYVGVKMVLKQLEDVLGRHGVKAFTAVGQPFDPRFHEAMQQVPTADHPPNTVVAEHARGFMLNDRLLRPAMVAVSAKAADAPSDTSANVGEAAPDGSPPEGNGSKVESP